MNPTFKRCVAWLLAVTMLNPWAAWGQVPPPYAGDHLIYTTTNAGAADSPGILLLIDTSDSMNIPEGWREYPGAYDSHVEYLWNDINVIQNAEQTTEHADRISTAAQPAVPFSRYGFWAGNTLADRQALWAAARTYANATEPGDPGARNTYRNYNNANWIYWLPAGTAETDARLRSPSFNRWAGGLRTVGGLRGGINFGGNDDYRGYNRCEISKDQFMPSTVFAPTAYPKNAGKYTGQEWQRWERWLDLRNGRSADGDTAYPTTLETNTAGTIAAGSGIGNVGANITARNGFLGPPAAGANPVRDSWPRLAPFSNGWTNIGDRGQPIRTQQGASRAGWTDLKADLGGFNFADSVNSYNSTVLRNTLTTYQATYYGTAPTTTNALHLAWKGNRDQTGPAPTFDNLVGTPAYYDSAATNLRFTSGVTTLCTRTCTVDADLGAGGNQAPFAATLNNDGNNTARYWVKAGASCVSTGTSGSDCSTLPAACGTPATGSNYVNANRTGCAWSGRLSNYVEGEGTWYYGGTCSGSCRGEGYGLGAASCESGATSTSYCTAGGSTVTRNSIVMTNAVLNNATSNCSDNADLTQTCPTRQGEAGCYWVSGLSPCANQTVTSGSTTDYSVHTLVAREDYLTHDCRADNGTAGNPGNGYLSNQAGIPFNTAWSNAAGANLPYAAGDPGVSYPAADMYSVNYLNWKYGPKGPNGHPIGRKTRLQIAKDALTDLVATTNGVRFGLEVFNKSTACLQTFAITRGGSTTVTLPSNPGFTVGQNITLQGAGAGGANLNTTISAIAGSDITVATAPSRSIGLATTGDTAAGSNQLTVASADGFVTGSVLRIVAAGASGADLVASITAIAGSTFTLSSSASTTIAGATVLTNPEQATMTANPCSGSIASEGGHIAYKITTMGPKNCSLVSPTTTGSINAGSNLLTLASNPGFGVGNTITVPGAGAGGTDLVATINSITGTSITLSTTAATTVAGVTLVVPACSAAETTAYANRAVLSSRINGLVAAARTPLTESLFEAYRYFRGEAPVYGRLATTAVSGGAVAAGCDKTAFQTPGGGADCTGSSGNYVSPMLSAIDPTTGQPAACQKNFVLLVTDGGPEDDFTSNAAVQALNYAGISGTISPHTHTDETQADTPSGQFETGGAPYGPTDLAGGGYVWLDELAYYMASADMNPAIDGRQPVITYTIGFAGANTPVLQNAAARAGGNNYVADDAEQLAAALTEAVAAIREWNPTGGAPTVPISALNRSENADDIYLAFFGPSSSQSWSGTVKKFRLGEGEAICGLTTGGLPIELCLTGKTELSGTVKNIELTEVDPITGEENVVVNPATVSYWNPTNFQDGARPYQGGTGQRLRDSGAWTPATRKIYTFLTNPAGGAVSTEASLAHADNAFSEGNTARVTKARLGNAAMTDGERAARINYILGGSQGDANCTDASGGTVCSAFRTWPHHDVLHSRPAVVTYDPTPVADPEDPEPDPALQRQIPTTEHLIYFSNDGLLNAIDTATGDMVWSFLLEEALPHLGDVMNNLAGQHLMLADGAPVVWIHDANKNGKVEPAGGDKVYLFFGLRRGGRAYYALDITDPAAPQFMWKIDRRPAGAQFCTPAACVAAPDFDELGYTWSAPALGRLKAIAAASQPAMIFGGGYDPNQDSLSPIAADTMGRAVYVVNGATGALLKAFKTGATGLTGTMGFSIPSDVAALNTDLDAQGHLDRIYVGDMAANLWRFDINDPDPANWTGKKLAALSAPFALPATVPNRKIMTPPAVVKQNYLGQRYDAVYVGTGDREHPLGETTADRMFMIKDTDVGLASTAWSVDVSVDDFLDITNILTAVDLAAAGISAANWATKAGWYLAFAAGEKVMSAPTVFRNILRFSTYTPLENISSCVPPGKSVIYGMDALYGGLVAGTYGTSAGTNQQARQYVGFATRGIIPTGSVIVRGKKVYVVHVSDGRLLYRQIGTIGGAIKTYWYRQSQR